MLIFALLAIALLIYNTNLLIRRTRARQPIRAAGWGLASGLALLLFTVTSLNLPGTPATVSTAPPPAPAVTAPTTERTPAQNLAILADRDPNDPAIASLLARLDAACPENGSHVADIVVNLQQMVLSESGRDLSIENVMTQLINAQEGPAQEGGTTCPETGALLATLMIEGM
ncbi:hypothetical protein [Deinococcus sp. QL22]|uniref:hypothetical protein n=1 Tax=Deinococcus sp. QL22 TaxID=2939437 RepID=UPI00201716D6|nr:hypothetical protein [Deinococcus sp. QL22]UQN10287.1 hypothetical protein M1R55_29490 [Deinococcus sp. QL22]UQN10421.1 hypothetical protein M1R55_28815 [Deinococcus sp. QL22]